MTNKIIDAIKSTTDGEGYFKFVIDHREDLSAEELSEIVQFTIEEDYYEALIEIGKRFSIYDLVSKDTKLVTAAIRSGNVKALKYILRYPRLQISTSLISTSYRGNRVNNLETINNLITSYILNGRNGLSFST